MSNGHARKYLALLALAGGCVPEAHSADLSHAPRPRRAEARAQTAPRPTPQHPQGATPAVPAPRADAPAGDLRAIAAGNNAFAADLYARVRQAPGNLVFSPASVSVGLGMASAGARGETATQLRHALRFTLPDDRLHAAMGTLVRRWNVSDADTQLATANRLYGQRDLAFERDFLGLTARDYRAPLDAVNFREPEPARVSINQWVGAQTRGRIAELIPRDGISNVTQLVLVNAMYYRGQWETAFPQNVTTPEPFSVPGASARPQVPMMHLRGGLVYGHTDGVHAVELPYRGNSFSMVVFVPEREDGLAEMEAHVARGAIDRWVNQMQVRDVDLSLPRFRAAPAQSMQLSTALQAMGAALPFDRRHADFTGIAPMPTPSDRLFISEVFHKALVEVDERGTVAAAATAVVFQGPTAMPSARPEPEPVTVRADRPFVFVLRDRTTGMILFVGRVTDPRA